jgi:tagatose 1,6-diphosphate aldolase GatY/KbaY
MLEKAYEGHYAIPAFNVDNYEIMKAIVNACESKKSPVILMFTTSAIKYYGLSNLIDVASNLAKEASIEIATHLDHQPDVDICKQAIDCGITSVMYDGSHETVQVNISTTNEIINHISGRDISVETELGQISGVEDWKKVDEVIYTDPKEAKLFFDSAKIDCLAIAIGTAHGIYKFEPKLNVDLLKEINQLVKKPLVLHGGSGLKIAEVQECIANGIAKVNFGTEIKLHFSKSCKEYLSECSEFKDVRKMLLHAMEKLETLIFEKIKMCLSEGKSDEK